MVMVYYLALDLQIQEKEVCGGDNRVFVFWLTRFWDRERRRRRRRKFRDNCRKKGKKKVLMISHRWE